MESGLPTLVNAPDTDDEDEEAIKPQEQKGTKKTGVRDFPTYDLTVEEKTTPTTTISPTSTPTPSRSWAVLKEYQHSPLYEHVFRLSGPTCQWNIEDFSPRRSSTAIISSYFTKKTSFGSRDGCTADAPPATPNATKPNLRQLQLVPTNIHGPPTTGANRYHPIQNHPLQQREQTGVRRRSGTCILGAPFSPKMG